ncbi:hypothetical protein [Pseudomonas vancouverensis]|uniref:Uncharacterized protein n=1 Tax=Pseudomonas vancouverensis TaxID=95300 RepID=A0A1H2PBA1_PSEVA|nr:hypothetical protein [Pseudomonas vancouverensis]KAB0490087.1 hypothetical protein F7R09_27670 [Pseudomonas vancouverensis]TDB58809.1 hypothetical protein EIY72_21155 [Pseudomonas vancouverensis]SDV14266.1 hypothetical protein SAMN05216558_4342 [Pseudomonas vancouverensis]
MNGQYEGELSFSIDGVGDFTTKDVKFLRAGDASGFILQGVDAERSLVFHIPNSKGGKYSLASGGAAKAFYLVAGRPYGEVERGFIDVMPSNSGTVGIAFDISVKGYSRGSIVRLTGSGTFKDAGPSVDKCGELSSVMRNGSSTSWPKPTIGPFRGEVSPGFEVMGSTTTGPGTPHRWEAIFYVDDLMAHHVEQEFSGRLFLLSTPVDMVKPGQFLFYRLRYLLDGIWSGWADSDDLQVLNPSPVILEPINGATVFPNQPVQGQGIPGAEVSLWGVYGGGWNLQGTATVSSSGSWEVTSHEPFPVRNNFWIFATQVDKGIDSVWSKPVDLIVVPGEWKPVKPIVEPLRGEVSPGFEVMGSTAIGPGTPNRWEVVFYVDGQMALRVEQAFNGRVFSLSTPVGMVKPGESLTYSVRYLLEGFWSEWADSDNIQVLNPCPVILEPISGATVFPDQPVHGQGIPGAEISLWGVYQQERVLHGTATVGPSGSWKVTSSIPFPVSIDFCIYATQVDKGIGSVWSKPVNLIVVPEVIKPAKPIIMLPKQGENVTSIGPVTGLADRPGAYVKLYQVGDEYTVYGETPVMDHGVWAMFTTKNLPSGQFSMTAKLFDHDMESDWADPVECFVIAVSSTN